MSDTSALITAVEAGLARCAYCFATTVSDAGVVSSRLVEPIAGDDLTVRIGTSPRSRKARDVRSGSRVLLGFHDADAFAYVTLDGAASIQDDVGVRRRYWRETWRPFFPAGPEGDDFVIVEVRPERIELMDFERKVTPPPFGLRPAVLVRRSGGWVQEDAWRLP